MTMSEQSDPTPSTRNAPSTSRPPRHSGSSETDAPEATPGQLRLIPTPRRTIPEWELDEYTRRIGREGVAAARAALRRIRPESDAVAGRRAS